MRTLLSAFALFFALGAFALAANQVKTTETHITTSFNSIVGPVSTSSVFSLYLGDNLSGITDPVKSLHVALSGVYTGTGSLTARIDDAPATEQAFALPNVSTTPTPFEILYKDPTNSINPQSAGTYSYTLNLSVPAGMTIYGLGAKALESHEHVPPACPDGQPANEKVKTTETHITTSFNSIVGPVSTSSVFSLYLGDNLSGITDPVKSLHVALSGVYTGTGSLTARIDDAPATEQAFALPNVSTTPTPFEILYKDPTNSINPQSAGTYSYTLNLSVPAGMTIYGLGAKALETHRYKPPPCGGGYAASGYVESSTFDTAVADGAAYNSIFWKGDALLANTKVQLQLATDAEGDGPWTFIGDANGDGTCGQSEFYEPAPDTPSTIACAEHTNKRYFRYKVILCSDTASNCTSSGINTPTVTDVIVNWSP